MAEKPSLIFMGTPPFAATVLAYLLESGHSVQAVYTQPDKPAGRKLGFQPSAVKELALKHGLPVLQPANFRNERDVETLAAFRPDFLIVAAYGLILPQAVLEVPKVAPLNIHGSLLPKYRGAAPIQRAIMENWGPGAFTGVTLMKIILAMDAGPVYGSVAVPIGENTSGTMAEALACAGGKLLVELLPEVAAGALQPLAQDDAEATYASKLTKADGLIDWVRPALAVDAQIRAVTPWPSAQANLDFGSDPIRLTILSGRVGPVAEEPAGTVAITKTGLAIACQDNWYELLQVKPEGRRPMPGGAFVNGLRLKPGTRGHASAVE